MPATEPRLTTQDIGRAPHAAVRVLSPAKVNLYLGVTSTRADGYHELATVFERVALADELVFAWRDAGISCASDAPALPTDERNIVMRAAQLLQVRSGCTQGVHVTIHKRIPVAAGLGGGSSNAAVALSTLNRQWELGLSREALTSLGRELGADVPFFLAETPWALGVGRGDVLVTLPATITLWHVLVTPRIALSTADVFHTWDALGSSAGGANVSSLARVLTGLLEGQAEDVAGATWNHLTTAATRLAPAIQRIVAVLTRCGARAVSLTGSGPTVMATLATAEEAERLAADVAHAQPEWQVIVTHTLNEDSRHRTTDIGQQ